jgi:hypothetical protein
MAAGGHFDGDEIADGEAVVGIDEFLGGGVGVVEDEADDGAIETLNDRKCEDSHFGVIEGVEEFRERSDPVFSENGDLADAGNVSAAIYLWFFPDGGHREKV